VTLNGLEACLCLKLLADSVEYVLLVRAVMEYRWSGRRNLTFMCHKCFVLTLKKWLKSVYIYGCYRRIETGVGLNLSLFGPPSTLLRLMLLLIGIFCE